MSNEQDPQDSRSPDTPEDTQVRSSPLVATISVPNWLVMCEVVGLFMLTLGTFLAVSGHLDRPAAGATRSSILQNEERERSIEQAIQAELANTSDRTAHAPSD
jgi:hypothetical protein